MNVASIDIGSNTILLLIVEIDKNTHTFKTLLNEVRITRIYQGLNKTFNISEEKIKLLYEILKEFNEIISNYYCVNTLIRATKAFRVANNSTSIIEDIKSMYNYDITILTGEEEAQLSFIGSTSPWVSSENKFVIDIGDGSTELIYGNRIKIHNKISLDFGVVSLTEKFFPIYSPNRNQIHQLEEYLKKYFSEFNMKKTKSEVIAVAGTPTTLSCMKQNLKQFNESVVDNSYLCLNDIEEISYLLSQLSKEEILRTYGNVVMGREDLLLAGSLILKIFMQFINVNEITVSTKGLRYGVIIDYLDKLNWDL